MTVFGIRWLHYIWILPVIVYAFFPAVIIIIYAGIISFLAHLYWMPYLLESFLFNVNIILLIYLFIIPILVFLSALITYGGFIRFFKVMQYKQDKINGWKKTFGKALLYGICAPLLAYPMAYISAEKICL